MVQKEETRENRLSSDYPLAHPIADINRHDVPREYSSGKNGKMKPDMIGDS